MDADPTPFPYWLDYFRTGRVPMVDAAVRDKVVLESELVGLAELADALRAQEDTELGRVKKELTEMREEVREMREKVAAILESAQGWSWHTFSGPQLGQSPLFHRIL